MNLLTFNYKLQENPEHRDMFLVQIAELLTSYYLCVVENLKISWLTIMSSRK